MSLTSSDINDLLLAQHLDPHAVLGLRKLGIDKHYTITCLLPEVEQVEILTRHDDKILAKVNENCRTWIVSADLEISIRQLNTH